MENRRFSLYPAPPYRLDLTVWVLRRRASSKIDSFDGTTYRRAMLLDGVTVLAAVRQLGPPDHPELRVNLASQNPTAGIEEAAAAALGRLLGLDIDLGGFYEMAETDSDLAPIAKRFKGMRPPRFLTLFESIANGIIFQQISIDAAISILNRFLQTYGEPIHGKEGAAYIFPEPAVLAQAGIEEVKKSGFTLNKARALIEAARAIEDDRLTLQGLEAMDNQSACATLVNLRGIGKWTADYVLLRGLGRLDVFPRTDVGARKGLTLWLDRKFTDEAMEEIFSRWRNYAGLVYFHILLRGLAEKGLLK